MSGGRAYARRTGYTVARPRRAARPPYDQEHPMDELKAQLNMLNERLQQLMVRL